MHTFIKNLPKVELHCHIEGTFEPDLMFKIAKRNGIELPYASVEALQQAYDFSQLQDFLDIYYQGMNVLLTEQDYFDLTWAYLSKVHEQNVRHTEIFFDPQGHVSRGVAFDTVMKGITSALDKAKDEWGMTSQIILCFLRHLDEDDAFKTLEMAKPWQSRIIGVGLDSSERGNPPEKFARVFAEAKQQGYLTVAHAGEEGPPEYVWSALKDLQVSRIDHGNSSLQDEALVDYLVKHKMPLTVCPLSNTKLCVVDDMRDHPIRTMLDKGLHATVNSDDPAYFGGYMNENYQAITDALGLDNKHLELLAKNGIEAAFVSADRKSVLLKELSDYCGSFS